MNNFCQNISYNEDIKIDVTLKHFSIKAKNAQLSAYDKNLVESYIIHLCLVQMTSMKCTVWSWKITKSTGKINCTCPSKHCVCLRSKDVHEYCCMPKVQKQHIDLPVWKKLNIMKHQNIFCLSFYFEKYVCKKHLPAKNPQHLTSDSQLLKKLTLAIRDWKRWGSLQHRSVCVQVCAIQAWVIAGCGFLQAANPAFQHCTSALNLLVALSNGPYWPTFIPLKTTISF